MAHPKTLDSLARPTPKPPPPPAYPPPAKLSAKPSAKAWAKQSKCNHFPSSHVNPASLSFALVPPVLGTTAPPTVFPVQPI